MAVLVSRNLVVVPSCVLMCNHEFFCSYVILGCLLEIEDGHHIVQGYEVLLCDCNAIGRTLRLLVVEAEELAVELECNMVPGA